MRAWHMVWYFCAGLHGSCIITREAGRIPPFSADSLLSLYRKEKMLTARLLNRNYVGVACDIARKQQFSTILKNVAASTVTISHRLTDLQQYRHKSEGVKGAVIGIDLGTTFSC
ncbi:uncharacterized protein LOC114929455 [Nylanderia fulva]|uniref:uncharacterized protein LOC114929455 n=1 Tax=Nylanderia fulva TaxID=613905 RepID=UPI0010FB5C1C|nr:uncharacterized protein LOC114929455 [Nylanderia fulva]